MNRMRFNISAILLTICSTVAAQSLTPVFNDIDCGQILFCNPAAITVELRNNTAQAVTIKGVDTGCGCTVAEYDRGQIMPGTTTKVKLNFDAKQLGHFVRLVRIIDSGDTTPAEINVRGQVVTKLINYSGDYPCKLGELFSDVDNIEFDDVNKGQRMIHEINIMNPTGQNVQPTALRLPPYLEVKTYPEVIGPKQKGIMYVTLKSRDLRDYGLTQTSFYLAKSPADKVTQDKEISVTAVLLPPAVALDAPSRQNAPKIVLSAEEIDMTILAKKAKAKGEIEITNSGSSTLEISKMQLFTSGLEVQLGKATLQPGETTRLKVTARAKEINKTKRRPRILMITNDPDKQKVVILIRK